MLSRSWPKLIAASLALILCVAVVEAWRADRRDRAQLASELAATKQLLAAADARQRARDAQLAKTLSALDAQKRAIVTPEQIVRHLSKNILLPAPVTLQSGQASSAGPRSNASQTSSTPQEQAVALTKERDDALRIAKGGNAWRRVGRAAKWFLLGTAVGAVLAKAR